MTRRSSVPTVWRKLTPGQRGVALGYLWLAVGLGAATRAYVLTVGLLLLFPVVVGVIRGFGRAK